MTTLETIIELENNRTALGPVRYRQLQHYFEYGYWELKWRTVEYGYNEHGYSALRIYGFILTVPFLLIN